MEKKVVSKIMLTLLITNILILAFNIQLVRAEPTTWYVDDDGEADFTKIQPAITAASPGDNIFVYSGTYYEHVSVYKDGLTVVGENKNSTIIDGGGTSTVLRVAAMNVTISGFKVQNSGWGSYYSQGSGIYLYHPYKVRGCNISYNIISNCRYGISLWQSINNTISGNIISNTEQGISFDSSNDNTINGNTISNAGVGVSFFNPAYNNLGDNTISDIEYDGVVFWNPYYNNVAGNLITNCSGVGVRIRAGYENTIIVNTITESDYGVLFYLSDHNVIQENSITGSEWNGISLFNSSENTVNENNITTNRNGIITQWAQNNSIYHNNFVENTFQVITYDSVNIWDDGFPSGGNCWSDYGGIDFYSGPYQNETTSDGIGDTPYIIDADNQDNYPLMNPWTPAPPTVVATADVAPSTLNLKSKGKWITCRIELPEGYNVSDIDISTVMLNSEVAAELHPTEIGDYDTNGILDLMVKFSRTELRAHVYHTLGIRHENVTLTITGQLADGTPFEGSDNIKVMFGGDADLSGYVETADFFIWRENFGKTPDQCPPSVYPDFDDNGLVETSDFFIWRENFGATVPPPP